MLKKIALYGGFSAVMVASVTVIILRLLSLSSEGAAPVQSNTMSSPIDITTPIPRMSPPLQDLNGNWAADNNNGGTITAVVKDEQITLIINNEGAKMLYWVGTFQSFASVGDMVKSTKVDVPKAVLSRATSKDFIIGEGTISFELSVMGKTTIVELRYA